MPLRVRARPWLGTLVEIRVRADAPEAVIEAGFAAIERVHRTLSFHDPSSELTHLNAHAADGSMSVSTLTAEVLRAALEIAHASDGAFDPTCGAALVDAGLRPRPAALREPDRAATWRDVVLDHARRVRFARPLWLDLGGIAKGYAVDVAMRALRDAGADTAVVNAGGDLAVWGNADAPIAMRSADGTCRLIDLGVLRDGAAAGSAVAAGLRSHFDGRSRAMLGIRRAATVIAPDCMVADALTKVVLSDPAAAAPVLRRYGATACAIEADGVVQRWDTAA